MLLTYFRAHWPRLLIVLFFSPVLAALALELVARSFDGWATHKEMGLLELFATNVYLYSIAFCVPTYLTILFFVFPILTVMHRMIGLNLWNVIIVCAIGGGIIAPMLVKLIFSAFVAWNGGELNQSLIPIAWNEELVAFTTAGITIGLALWVLAGFNTIKKNVARTDY